ATATARFSHATGDCAFTVEYCGGKQFGVIGGERAEIQLTRLPVPGNGTHLLHRATQKTPLSIDAVDGATVIRIGARRWTLLPPKSFRAAAEADAHDAGGGVLAPMPGVVAGIDVRAGRRVARGAPLLTLEAMKMEHTVRAPRAGKVVRLHFRKGDAVREGEKLLDWEDA
ncbi:MAG: hypothetical protein MPK30_05250, partial [Gammaproteobacteria bacterium]|nr:hypothetical protein [Gammaproteobacteria bacterium]